MTLRRFVGLRQAGIDRIIRLAEQHTPRDDRTHYIDALDREAWVQYYGPLNRWARREGVYDA